MKAPGTPVLAPVGADQADRLSPWPGRIAGTRPWSPRRRSAAHIEAEYDAGWYAALLPRWTRYWTGLPPEHRHPGSALRFFEDLRRSNNEAMRANDTVYGDVTVEGHLVSVADQLYAADINLFESLYRMLVVERVAAARGHVPFDTLVEVGCGTGVNLVNLYVRCGLRAVAGCDVSGNAVAFLTRLAADAGIPATFRRGDYRDPSVLGDLIPSTGAWALLSVHAVEQSETLPAEWFERLLASPNPPRLGLHFEPLQWRDDGTFAAQCARYAEINGYNGDLLQSLRAAERRKSLRIVWAEKRVLGASAFNPTSVVMWVAGGATS